MSAPATLPAASWQDPACGACGSDTYHDGDGYVCEPCGLWFDQGDDLAPDYLDEEAEPCGEPCSNTWHGSRTLGPYDCKPCHLPAGHESLHHTPCEPLPRHTVKEPSDVRP